MERSSVSVVIATYNGEKYIKEQLDSILLQLKENDEVVISDDGSTDGTLDIINQIAYKDARVKVIEGPKNGYNKNFENAINHSKNEYIFICDQDDVWMENKVDVVLAKFTDEIACIRHDAIVVDGQFNVICESYNDMRKSNINYKKNIYKNTFTGCCMCVKREWLMKLLPFPNDVFYDAWIGILSCKYKKALVINDKLIYWRRHNSTVTKLKRNSIWWILKDRMKLYKKIRRKKV